MDEKIKIHYNGFDYLRVLASFIVVFIHASFTSPALNKWNLGGIPVPCFIMMSVFLLGNKKYHNKIDTVTSLLKKIMPQYIFWTAAYLTLRYLKFQLLHQEFKIGFDEIFLGGSAVQLWFLPAIFLWQLIMLFLYSYTKTFVDIFLCIMLFLTGYYFNLFHHENWSFINYFTFNMGYILVGKIVYNNFSRLVKFDYKYFLILVVISIFTLCYEKFLDWNVYQMYFTHVLCSIATFILFALIKKPANILLKSLSKFSFGIYLSHFLFYQLFYQIFIICKVEMTLSITLLNIFLTYLCSYLICLLMSRNKYLNKVI